MMGHLDDIAARGEAAVTELREAAGTLDKLLLHQGPELLDLDSTPAEVKRRILADVERLTRLLQLHHLWTHRIGRLVLDARRTRRGKPVRVLDVGAGGGGLLFRLADWARRRRIPVELYGVDATPEAIAAARRTAGEEGRHVDLRVGDARRLDHLPDGAVDVAVSTFTLHHLEAGDAARALAELDRVAAVNFFAFDLRRNLGALPAAWALLRLGGFDAPSRHDGLLSLRRGYSIAEVEALTRSAAIANAAVQPVAGAFLVVTRA
jgi:SAM-dependent methyltransferase